MMRICLLIVLTLFSAGLVAQPAPPVLQSSTSQPQTGHFEISGTVVDSTTLQPLSHARVSVAPGSGKDQYSVAVTGEDGRFLFGDLAAGKYTLSGQRRGYVSQYLDGHQGFSSAVIVGPEKDSSNVVFRLDTENVISGTVVDEHGEAVRDAQVMLYQSGVSSGLRRTRRLNQDTTNDEGRFHFAHLAAGRYFISVSAKPWYAQRPVRNAKLTTVESGSNISSFYESSGETSKVSIDEQRSPLDVAYRTTFYGGATNSAGATAIVLGKGEKVVADITLQPVPAMHVRTPASGTPGQPFFTLLSEKVFDEAMPVATESVEISPGVIELVGVAPGRYSMKESNVSGLETAKEQEIDVSADAEIRTEEEGAPMPVSATLQAGPAEKTPGHAVLYLRDRNSAQFFEADVNDKGEAEFKPGVPPGNYEFLLQRAPDFFTKSISATGASVSGHTVRIKDVGPVKLNITVGYGQGSVSGSALRNGKPVAGAMIVLVPADPVNDEVAFRRDQSDSDGTFALASITPGRYTLLAIENGWDLEWANPDVLSKFMLQGKKVTVEPKGKYSMEVSVQ
jgi:Carboxypeptidase regulatory-like domain